jgi:hypothetical protein
MSFGPYLKSEVCDYVIVDFRGMTKNIPSFCMWDDDTLLFIEKNNICKCSINTIYYTFKE